MTTKLPNNDRMVTCPNCNEPVQADRLEEHKARAHELEIKQTNISVAPKGERICPICWEYVKKRNWRSHVKNCLKKRRYKGTKKDNNIQVPPNSPSSKQKSHVQNYVKEPKKRIEGTQKDNNIQGLLILPPPKREIVKLHIKEIYTYLMNTEWFPHIKSGLKIKLLLTNSQRYQKCQNMF